MTTHYNQMSCLPEWQLELIKKYPLIYTETDDQNAKEEDYCNLRYGFEFGQGWAKLVDDFSRTASELVVHLRATIQPNAFIHANIFKEKLGTLRWQGRDNLTDPFRELFDGYVDYIESCSKQICEITGKRGELRSVNGWLTTMCDDEYAKKAQKTAKQ